VTSACSAFRREKASPAWQQAAVDICNLQTDTFRAGPNQPARQTGRSRVDRCAHARGGQIARGVLGIALSEAHDSTMAERQFLLDLAAVTGTVVG